MASFLLLLPDEMKERIARVAFERSWRSPRYRRVTLSEVVVEALESLYGNAAAEETQQEQAS